MKRFLTSVSLQHEPKASDVITLVKKTFFARVSYEILYHEVWNKSIFPYYNGHGSHENSFYILNMHWINFIPNQSFMNILHGY